MDRGEWAGIGFGQEQRPLLQGISHFVFVYSQSIFGSVLSSDPLSVMAYGICAVHLYVFDFHFQASPDTASVQRITDTGVPGVVFNGVSDWLYSGMLA